MTEGGGRPDPNVSQRGAADPGASAWVAASAGTGKTKVLTDRVLRLLLADTAPERILCLTFTKAAAAEMNNRLNAVLGRWAADTDAALEKDLRQVLGGAPDDDQRALARRLFPRVLEVPGGMRIHTIHGFCQTVLARFPFEADLAPHFQVLTERDQEAGLAVARSRMLEAALRKAALGAALTDLTRYAHETTIDALLHDVAAVRGRLTDAAGRHGSPEGVVAAVYRALELGPGETSDAVLAAASADPACDEAALRRAAAILAEGQKTDKERAERMRPWLEADTAARADGFDAYTLAYLTKDREARARLVTKGLLVQHPELDEVLGAEAARVQNVLARRHAAVTAAATAALVRLGFSFLSRYDDAKRARARLDFDDLIARTADLLEESGGASWVLYKLDGGIDHVLVDEAQDTSPAQWRVIRALTSEFFTGESARDEARTVFAVGDVKQSIYSFQGADPTKFVDARDHFGEHVRAVGGDWRPIDLEVSFRSTRAVLAAVDAVFRRPEARAGVALDGHDVVHRAWRLEDGGMVELWPLVTPRPTDAVRPWAPPVERVPGDSPEARMAALVAGRIKRMVDTERLESKGRPIRPGDIMVLVQRRGGFVEDLVRRLKGLKVPVAGVDRMILTEQMAVMDLMALGHAALLPEDDLNLAAVLKSPLMGLDEDQLFRLAHGRERRRLWARLNELAESDAALAAARDRLRAVLGLADRVPPFDFYAQVLGPLEGRRRLLARLGVEADDPIAEFMDLALAYERTQAPSLQGFLHWVERTAVEIKRDLETDAPDAVRVMTVHGAKGLQAPIVFLPDTVRLPRRDGAPILWAGSEAEEVPLWPPRAEHRVGAAETAQAALRARQEDEYRRLLYVAMTRAEDRLIVAGWHGKNGPKDDCWYRLIQVALDSVDTGRVTLDSATDPFLAASAEIDEGEVVRVHCPQQKVPEPPKSRELPEIPELPAWARRPAPAEPAPPKPLAPSRIDADAPPARSPTAAAGGDDVRFRRGRLIHRLLQSLPDHAPAARAGIAEAWLQQRAHGLDAVAQAEVAATALAVLDHPDCAPAFAAGSRAEVPVTGVVGGHVVAGQVDRLAVTADAVLVLDFKSERTPPTDAARVPKAYLRQMALYRAVLSAVYPDRPVRCLLLWTEGPTVMPLPDAVLDGVMRSFTPAR